MPSNKSSIVSTLEHPPLGTWIHPGEPVGSLQLVEVLGVGGYGVVYRAVPVEHSSDTSQYAVKCLMHSTGESVTRKGLHERERKLHQLVSAHPNVVTLHCVFEEPGKTYMIMEYAPNQDLFTQILHNRRYLGNSGLIKEIFLQLLDAVEHCHYHGVYHRDLKPENILCFDDGHRIALTDFGLATEEKMSHEYRTGSVYHMSPECQDGGSFSSDAYAPEVNDVWSLGIILLNLTTGRNPWKSATRDDPTFQAYLQDPYKFLPAVLPISDELNQILVRTLEVRWRRRIPVDKLRQDIHLIDNLYSQTAVFDGSLARCEWETSSMNNGSTEEPDDDQGMYYDGEEAQPVSPPSLARDSSEAYYTPPTTDDDKDARTWDKISDLHGREVLHTPARAHLDVNHKRTYTVFSRDTVLTELLPNRKSRTTINNPFDDSSMSEASSIHLMAHASVSDKPVTYPAADITMPSGAHVIGRRPRPPPQVFPSSELCAASALSTEQHPPSAYHDTGWTGAPNLDFTCDFMNTAVSPAMTKMTANSPQQGYVSIPQAPACSPMKSIWPTRSGRQGMLSRFLPCLSAPSMSSLGSYPAQRRHSFQPAFEASLGM